MDVIRIYIEKILTSCGLTGSSVSVLCHLLMVIMAALLAMLVGWICRRLFVPLILRMTAKTKAQWDDILFNKTVLLSASHILPAIVIWALLPLVFYQFPSAQEVLKRLTAIYITVMTTRTLTVFTDGFKRLDNTGGSSLQQYLYTFCDVLRIVLYFIAAIVVVAITINRSPATLLAGLSATSAVLMLVFQDTITGVVAGIRLTRNDMLHRGDWITVPKAGINGVVEDIWLTTVKVRNFDNTILTISPKTLINESFQNWKGMEESDGRRALRLVYFDFQSVTIADEKLRNSLVERGYLKAEEMAKDAVNITLYRQYLEKWLANQPLVNKQSWILVRQAEATQNGMAIEVQFYLTEKSYIPFEHLTSEIMEYIYAVAPHFGLRIYQQAYRQQ